MGENSEVPGPLRMRVEVQGGDGTRLLRARSQGTEVPSGEGQSWRGKDSRSRWGSKRPDGLPKVGGGSGPDEKKGTEADGNAVRSQRAAMEMWPTGREGSGVCGGAAACRLAARTSPPPPLGQYLSTGNT